MGSRRKQAEKQRQQGEEGSSRMCGQPCIRSVCGMKLQTAVYIIGLVELIITVGCSIKYLYVFVVSDWTSLEDWVSISYLAFYTVVTLVVVSFTKECGTSDGGVVHDYGAPPAYKA